MEKIEKLTDNHENENTKQRKLNLKNNWKWEKKSSHNYPENGFAILKVPFFYKTEN